MSFLTLRLGISLLLALTLPARAQFAQLAATDDGKQLYFTSQLLLHGAAPNPGLPETRVYRAASGQVTLFAERGALAPQDGSSSGDGAALPQVTADGSIVAFTYSNICAPNSDCSTSIAQVAQLTGKQSLDLGPGTLQLSRNGRWALLMAMSLFPQNSTLIDLTTGQRTIVPPPPFIWFNPESPVIASDGTLLVEQPRPARSGRTPTYTVGLWKQGQFTPLDLDAVAISDDASTVISSGLVALDLATNKRTALVQ